MFCRRMAVMMVVALSPVSIYAANPFLNAPDDKPVSAIFRGTQWSDEIEQEEMPLIARVVTTRIAKQDWGAIFKIEFTDVTSRARKRAGVRPKKREIGPDYSIVTMIGSFY